MHGVQHLVQPVFRFNQIAMPAAVARQSLQQGSVDRPVDADGENPATLGGFLDLPQQVVLVADLAVGDEQQDLLATGIGRIGEILEGASQGGRDLGAAARLAVKRSCDSPRISAPNSPRSMTKTSPHLA
jgi:hypothetical protein